MGNKETGNDKEKEQIQMSAHASAGKSEADT